MRHYCITTYRYEESELVMKTLKKFEVTEVDRKDSIVRYELITFHCTKSEWKKIKKALNLEITSVYSKIRVEA